MLELNRIFKEKNYHTIIFNPLIGKEITNTIRKTKTDKQDCIKLTIYFGKGVFLIEIIQKTKFILN